MRAAHERDAVAATHEKHLEGVARPQQNNGGRRDSSNGTHRFVYIPMALFSLASVAPTRDKLHAIRLV
jgi:hypothetical protein